MTSPKQMTRRTWLQLGVGAVAGIAAGTGFARSPFDSSCGTPAQTEGPFYPKHDQADKDLDLTRIEGRAQRAEGEVIRVSGRVLDDDGQGVPGALIDVWQANRHGRYHHEDDPNPAPLDANFQGWGQFKTDDQGHYGFKTIVPGPYPVFAGWWRPPHIHFKVAKRGYRELTTQMYFAGHELNDKDRILLAIPESERVSVVVAFAPVEAEPGMKLGRFDLALCRVSRG